MSTTVLKYHSVRSKEIIQITDKYRIKAVMKVETNIIGSMKASLIGRAVVLVILSVKTF